jgi:ElaB/YqjD/DUF883 family membrane-anchored ribosome-binding protein
MQETTTGPMFGGLSREGTEHAERPSHKAEDAVNRVAEATASTVREVGMKGEQMRQQWLTTQDALVASARECVRTHPFASVAVAAVAGLLFSRFTR